MIERKVLHVPLVIVAVLFTANLDLQGQVVDRASVDSGGAQANNNSFDPSISQDGNRIVFDSNATNLVPGDTNGVTDIFVRDRGAGTTIRASVDSVGTQANAASPNATISANGDVVAFESGANNLVVGDGNGVQDVFVHVISTGSTSRVSIDSVGTQANGSSQNGVLSADGRFVAFESIATNLVAGDLNSTQDIFVHDRMTGATTRVSVDSVGTEANGLSIRPVISTDGRFVAFLSDATNLVAGDTNGVRDAFRHDTLTGTTIRVSVGSGGVQSNALTTVDLAISGDGNRIGMNSTATNLVAVDTNAQDDIFVRDVTAGTTVRVSVDSAGAEANGPSFDMHLNSDGRFVLFISSASNLVAGDTNGATDAFIHDLVTAQTVRVSTDAFGVEGNANSSAVALGDIGSFATFESFATNLVLGDTNGLRDIFTASNPLFPVAPPAAAVRLLCADPIGVSSSGGDRVRLRGVNLDTVQAVNLGASFSTADGAGTDLAILSSAEIEFTMPALTPGQKFIEVVAASSSDEIRDAMSVSGTGGSSSAVVEGGSTPQAYRMRSVPLFQNFGSVFGQLTACLGPANPRVWRAFFWDPQLQQYSEIQALLPQRASDSFAGRGIFLISRETKDCGFNGLSTEPATNFYLCLEPGWNMVSLPSSGSLSWSAVTVGTKGQGSTGADDVPASAPNPFVAEFLYAWDGTQYMSASALVEGEAYWAYNKTAGLVVLFANDPVPKSGSHSEQVLAGLPAEAPSPPPPPETYDAGVSGAPASGGGAGGGGGGDSATQVGFAGTPLLLLMSVILAAMSVSGRGRF